MTSSSRPGFARNFALGRSLAAALALAAAPASSTAQTTDPSPTPAPTAMESRDYSRPAYTGTSDLSDVRPFQSWIEDAVITQGIDIEPIVRWANDDFGSTFFSGAQAAYWLIDQLEVGGTFGFVSFDPDQGGGQSGISDLLLHTRYLLDMGGDVPDIAIGGTVDIPLGDEGDGQGTLDFSVFGATRYTLEGGLTLTGNIGIQSNETQARVVLPGGTVRITDDRENGLLLGGGAIIPTTDNLAVITEFNIGTAGEFAAISGGVDYELPPGGHLRAALALGLDNGAPDYIVYLGFAIPVY